GRVVARLGLLCTPEESRPPRPLVRAAEQTAFADLVPVRRERPRAPAPMRRPAWRRVSAAAIASFAALAIVVPRVGVTPEPAAARAAQEIDLAAYWREVPSRAPIVAEVQPRKRILRERPARMIDDALRQRALESVGRALAAQSPPV